MSKYFKPCINSFCTKKLQEIVGPVQTAPYVELQIYYQQVPQSQARLDKIEKTIMVADAKKPHIYKINDVA